MQDQADTSQLQPKNSCTVSSLPTQENVTTEILDKEFTKNSPVTNDCSKLAEEFEKPSKELEGSKSDKKISDSKEKTEDIVNCEDKENKKMESEKLVDDNELIDKQNEKFSDDKVETLTEAENGEKQSGVINKILNESDEKCLELKNEKLDQSENKELLPSLGILPEVESSTSANTVHSKCVRLSQLTESNSATVTDPSEVAHKVKRIKWKDSEVPIITQNNNGPCPLLAILNAMILKGKITLPRDRQELTGGELVSIVGNAVFDVPRSSVPSEMHSYLEQNTQDAVSILHKLLTGLDVNVKFSGVKDFEFTTELSIFDVLEVSLYHGWVVEPSNEAASLVSNLSYNQLTNNIIMWRDQATSAKDDNFLLKAMICEEFICESVSQLTIHGLFELGAALVDEEVAVLFRNNHFSTIYKKNGQLYQLLTDQGFLMESAIWETLTDIDATFSEFVNGAFQPIEQECTNEDITLMTKEQQINSDHQLAAMLQQEAEKQQRREEDFNKIVEDLGLHNLSDEEIARRLQSRENQLAEEANRSSSQTAEASSEPARPYNPSQLPTAGPQNKRKKDCTIL